MHSSLKRASWIHNASLVQTERLHRPYQVLLDFAQTAMVVSQA